MRLLFLFSSAMTLASPLDTRPSTAAFVPSALLLMEEMFDEQ